MHWGVFQPKGEGWIIPFPLVESADDALARLNGPAYRVPEDEGVAGHAMFLGHVAPLDGSSETEFTVLSWHPITHDKVTREWCQGEPCDAPNNGVIQLAPPW